jgi:hypothetical protein
MIPPHRETKRVLDFASEPPTITRKTVVIAVSTRQDVSVPSAYTAELDRSSQACTWGELRREFNIYRMGKNEKRKELPV